MDIDIWVMRRMVITKINFDTIWYEKYSETQPFMCSFLLNKNVQQNFGDRNSHFLSFRGLKIDKYYSLLYKYMACNNCANVFMHWMLLNNLFFKSILQNNFIFMLVDYLNELKIDYDIISMQNLSSLNNCWKSTSPKAATTLLANFDNIVTRAGNIVLMRNSELMI